MSNWHNQCSYSHTISKCTYCIHIIITQHNLCSLLSTSTRTTCPFNTACSLHKTLWWLWSPNLVSFSELPALHRVTSHKYWRQNLNRSRKKSRSISQFTVFHEAPTHNVRLQMKSINRKSSQQTAAFDLIIKLSRFTSCVHIFLKITFFHTEKIMKRMLIGFFLWLLDVIRDIFVISLWRSLVIPAIAVFQMSQVAGNLK